MKKSIFLLLFGICIACMIGSCTTEQEVSPPVPKSKGSFKLTCTVSGVKATKVYTIDATQDERKINSLWLLFFEYVPGNKGKFVDVIKAIDPKMGDTAIDGGLYDFPVDIPWGSPINSSTHYNVLVVANLEENLTNGLNNWLVDIIGSLDPTVSQDLTQEQLMSNIRTSVMGFDVQTNYSDNPFIPSALIMSAAVEKKADEETLKVELTRNVTRLDVKNSSKNYSLETASIWNGFPFTHVWDIPGMQYGGVERIKRLYGTNITGINEIIAQLYTYENYVAKPLVNDAVTTCLILGLKNNASNVVSYYRANISTDYIGQQLKRNGVYNVVINEVLADGYGTEEDAYRSSETRLDLTINNWSIDEAGNIVVDGENVLAVSASKILFKPEGGTRIHDIITLGKGDLFISKSELPSGITAIIEGSKLVVKASRSDDSRQGYIEIMFGKLKVVVNIEQTGDNTQFITLSSSQIPEFSSSGGVAESAIQVTSSSSWTAEILNVSASEPEFTFDGQPARTTVLTYKNSGESFKIKAGENGNMSIRYAFVLIKLDVNPDVTRTVLLTQQANGNFIISPNISGIEFSPAGKLMTFSTHDDKATFTVDKGASVNEWAATLIDSEKGQVGDKNFFDVQRIGNSFTVMATGANSLGRDLYATVRIEMTGAITKTIVVKQSAASITLSPDTEQTIIAAGGYTEQITVNTVPLGAAWEVTLSNGSRAKIREKTSNSFKVWMPDLLSPMLDDQVTARVTLTDYSISKTVTVKQSQRIVYDFILYNAVNGIGAIDSRDLSKKWFESITGLFSPTGVISTGTVSWDKGTLETTTTYIPSFNQGILVLPGLYDVSGSSTKNLRGDVIKAWIANAFGVNRVVIIVADAHNKNDDCVQMGTSYLGTVNNWDTGHSRGGKSTSDLHQLNGIRSTGASLTMNNCKLYQYLFRDGPFTNGEDISSKVSLIGGSDDYAGALAGYPPTMIPIFMHPKDKYKAEMVVGIEIQSSNHVPIVWIGDMEIFGTSSGQVAPNWNTSTETGIANYKFLNNLNAWIVNATTYGRAFTDQFVMQ